MLYLRVKIGKLFQPVCSLKNKSCLFEENKKMMVLEDGTVKCSWDDFETALDKFVKFYRENNLRFSGIYAVPRGGLVLGVCLSHRLELPLFYHCPDKSVLVVDDIADTGKTLLSFAGKSFIFTIFYHKQSLVVPGFWVYEKIGGWIEFPWERKF